MFYRNYVRRSNVWQAGIIGFLAGIAAWALFGKRIKDEFDRNQALQDLKKEISYKTSQISDLTREKYDELVDQAADKYAKLKGISRNELMDLAEDLKMHWGRIKNAWNEGGDNK
jgi:hypothetical protein